MTTPTINDYWPFLQAMKDGKTVQYQVASTWYELTDWDCITHYHTSDLRIKPEPNTKRVPLTADDLPDNPWFTFGVSGTCWGPSTVSRNGVDVGARTITFKALMDEMVWLYAPSHKGPWKPCYKEVNCD